jgi:hypothetical protein
VKNVFLNGELHEDVYIHPPPGYSVPEGMVCHLRRSLYGLLLLYMDGMIITDDDPEYIDFVKACLSYQFLMSDLGPLRYFLGIEISSTPEGFFLSQEKYIQDPLD